MKNIATTESLDLIEMRVIYHARKIYVATFIKAMLLMMILGLMSLSSKLWAQVPAESIVAVNQESTAEGKRMLAEWRSWYFEHQQKSSTEATMETKHALELAESNEQDKLFYLSTAQNLAIKSLDENDRSLQSLMAQQAYLFNEKYEGNPLDRYIYEGLYFALKSYTGDSLYLLSGHRGVVRDLAINSAGNELISAGTDGKIMDWNLDNPNHSGHAIMSSENGRCRVIKISSDDRWVIVGTDGSSIYCYDRQKSNRAPVIIKGHHGSVVDMAVMSDNRHFVSLSNDQTLRINDLMKGNGHMLKKLNEPYVKIAISPDGKYLALAAESGKLITVDIKNADQENVILPAGGPAIRSIAFNPTGDMLAVGNTSGIVKLVDLSFGAWLVFTELRGHTPDRYVNDVSFSEDGAFLASGGFDGAILLWDMNNLNNLPVILRDNSGQVWSLAFSHNSDYLYAGCEDGSIKVWPTRTEFMSDQLMSKLTRNMTTEEWIQYAHLDRTKPYEQTLSSMNP